MNDQVILASQDVNVALNTVDDMADARKYLVFMAGHLKLGVVAEDVVEILNNQVITYLPMMPNFIRGIINMRGQMIPIFDVRARLGLPPQEDSLVVVLNLNEVQLGILVDAVDQMLDIPRSNIHPLPANSTQMLVSGMCSLPDGSGTMMVLDCEQLMPNE